jgi:hypothetical protein
VFKIVLTLWFLQSKLLITIHQQQAQQEQQAGKNFKLTNSPQLQLLQFFKILD